MGMHLLWYFIFCPSKRRVFLHLTPVPSFCTELFFKKWGQRQVKYLANECFPPKKKIVGREEGGYFSDG